MDESNILFIKNRANTKKSIEKLEVDEKHVTIQSRTGGSVVVNFKGSEAEIKDVSTFFQGLNDVEPLAMNIASAGDVDHYFKGISDMTLDEADELYKLSVTLQFLTSTV